MGAQQTQILDLRNEQRFGIDQAVVVTILARNERHVEGRVADVSQSGLRLILAEWIPQGTTVKVEWERHFLVGTVRHIQWLEDLSYSAGIQLLTCSAWEQASYTRAISSPQAVDELRLKSGEEPNSRFCRRCGSRLGWLQNLFCREFCRPACRKSWAAEKLHHSVS